MSGRSIGLVVLLLAAIAGVFFLFGGPSAFFGSGHGPDTDEDGEAPAAIGPDAHDPTATNAAPAPRATLAVALRPERKGLGGLTLRVVRHTGGTPLEGAAVTVAGTGHGGENVLVTIPTSPDGVVLFASIAAGGAYELRVEAKGEPAVVVPEVEVRAGRTKDLGDVIVGAQGLLTGRVVDEKGKAVAGAEVAVYAAYESLADLMGNMIEVFGTLGREPKALAQGVTDGAGRFSLTGLASGPVAVRARAAGRRPAFVRTQMTPEGAASGPLTIKIEGGELVAGVVLDGAGGPVPGATIAVLASGNGQDPGEFLYGRIFSTTDAKGAFQAWVGRGEKALRAIVDAQGFPSTITAEFAAGAKDLRFVLLAGATVDVSVVAADDGSAISGAQVAMMITDKKDADGVDGSGGFLFGVTDPEGKVTFTSPPGRVEMLMVSHGEFASAAGSPGREGDTGMDMGLGVLQGDIPREVVPDEPAKFTVKLSRGVTLTGKVLDPAGKPIAGATLRTFSFGFGGSSSTRSDADGAFRLPGLVAATEGQSLTVMVKASGWVQTAKDMSVDASRSVNGELAHDFVMAPASTIAGRVVGPDGAPIAGAKVTAVLGAMGGDMGFMSDAPSAYTGADGRYVLREVEVTGGSLFLTIFDETEGIEETKKAPTGRVRVELEGFVSQSSAPFPVAQGAAIDAPEIALSRGQELTGIVREPNGRPAVGATVEWKREETSEGPEDSDPFRRGDGTKAATSDDGSYRVVGLPTGRIVVTFTAAGFVGARKRIDVGAGRLPPLDASLHEGVLAIVRVVSAEGAPIPSANCHLRAAHSPEEDDQPLVETQSVQTDSRGEAKLDRVPPGVKVVVWVSADGYKSKTHDGPLGIEPLVVTLRKVDPVVEARLQEIQKELIGLFFQKDANADGATKEARAKRMAELMSERRRLNGGSDPTDGMVIDDVELDSLPVGR